MTWLGQALSPPGLACHPPKASVLLSHKDPSRGRALTKKERIQGISAHRDGGVGGGLLGVVASHLVPSRRPLCGVWTSAWLGVGLWSGRVRLPAKGVGALGGVLLEQAFQSLPLHAWLTKCSLNLKSKLHSRALGVLTFWARLSDI